MRTVAVSGGFDPLHVGHLNLIRVAKALGDRVVVIVDSDEYVSSKHKLGMPLAERIRILESLADVDSALPNWTIDGDCSTLLGYMRPDVFLVGPDKDVEQLPEREICGRLEIEIVKAEGLKKEHSSRDYAKPQWTNPPVCCSVIVSDKQRRVLVGKRVDNGKWDLPGGFAEQGETLRQCVFREFTEETGCALETFSLRYFDSYVTHYQDGRQILLVVFTAQCVEKAFVASSELSELCWIDSLVGEMNNLGDAIALSQFFQE